MSADEHQSVDYRKKALPSWLLTRVLRREQKKLYGHFVESFPPQRRWRLLEVGTNGSLTDSRDYFLHHLYPFPEQITAAGLEAPDSFRRLFPRCPYVQVRRGEPLPFPDRSFDLVFSNAVLEHVGPQSAQRDFLAELFRVGDRAFVTTPNRWHPIEFHTATPFIHYLPTETYRRIYRALGFDFFANEDNLNLLDASALSALVPRDDRPRVEIGSHRFLGLRSNFLLSFRRPDRNG